MLEKINHNRKRLFNNGWRFTKTEIGVDYKEVISDKTKWYDVEIPHDWLILNTHDLYENGEGWYQKTFTLDNKDESLAYSFCFDGVYQDSEVFINGEKAGEWKYGYSSFEIPATAHLITGENTVIVRVRHEHPNSRWYSGAGIYRNVYFKTTSKAAIAENGIYISTDAKNGKAQVEIELNNGFSQDICGEIVVRIKDGENEVATSTDKFTLKADSEGVFAQSLTVNTPKIWTAKTPQSYQLEAMVYVNENLVDVDCATFGFKNFTFDTNEGFFDNGEYTKLHGVCLHHDLGALGAAYNVVASRRQLEIMKSMGVNAIRTSHNMPARELLDLCDEMGLYVVDEAFDMWELTITQYDYARFFPEWAKRDVASWIKRDRNHPCIIMWSIGNEIYDTHASERGLEITKMLAEEVAKHDPYKNAVATIGSNFMQWENAQKCSDVIKFAGYNYGESLYDDHHEKHPDWIIYGSETASTVASRGIYHFPIDVPALMHDDKQCSDLGNSVVSWGALYEKAWIMDRDRKFVLGQFVWTGMDYIGEPTPYQSKNSYFGSVDTAGLPKGGYYFYQSVWTDVNERPMIKLLPHWDWSEGQEVDVIAYSNADNVELFLNGSSLGKQTIDHAHGTVLHAHWRVKFTSGVLEARAYNEHGETIATDVAASFGDPVSLVAIPSKTELSADGRDLSFIEIYTVDEDGIIVENALNRIKVEVSGAGRLVGIDNGDSTDYDSYKGDNRKLFSGRLVAIVQSTLDSGEINVAISSKGLSGTNVILTANQAEKSAIEGISVVLDNAYPALQTEYTDEVPVRKIELSTDGDNILNKERPEANVFVKLLPENTTFTDLNDLIIKIVKTNGVVSEAAEAVIEDGVIKLKAVGDGEFRLRVMASNGDENPRVVSELPFVVEDLGIKAKSPYSFVSASFYDASNVTLKIIQKGALGGFDKRSVINYKGFDFGELGTRKLMIHVGSTLEGTTPIELWVGDPENGGRHITTAEFPSNNRWDGFEPQIFTLPEVLKGKLDISFVVSSAIIFGGFEFIETNKAIDRIYATEYSELYGDDFTEKEKCIEGIGNNVTIGFGEFNFGYFGAESITIFGRTPNAVNTIQIRYTQNGVQKTQVVEFEQSDDYVKKTFKLENIKGKADVHLVFLPGSNFDLGWFRFSFD